jgi:hypothetical protein
MNIYHIWCDPKEGTDPHIFIDKMKKFLDILVKQKRMETYRITRMKLGFRSMDIPDFHIMMEFHSMQQLDDAMQDVVCDKQTDKAHVGFNAMVDVETIQHALYRDWPETE